ncbi:glycosyltransferase family 2 protein [Pelosinus sp. UFO1]|uniref:glycosyltransferase family 2 protein n=1 Tax=Pelosinus sp. UFO1 TaxID=484770 RepID=UPI0004D0B56B|nr:glycosyltransferase family 2 protein [Pelosinus sp. UFO1]AIF53731.1 glycosyl transferase family 2 [Pelosinus sp. UFO1]
MRLSIALCTYNGERYLQEQLDSILNQTLLPEEVIICDDQSSDNTWNILEKFKKQAKFKVNLIRNDTNLGSTQNFAKAISLCSGDIIFLADQDDVWLPSKLQVIKEVFEKDQGVGMVFSDAIVTDEHLRPYPLSLWQCMKFDENMQKIVHQGRLSSKLIKRGYVTGCTMAFQKKWRFLLEPFPEIWIHDEWITFVTDLVSRVEFVPQKLIKYRKHDNQQIGVKIKSRSSFTNWRLSVFPEGNRRRCKRYIERMELVLERITAFRQYFRDTQICDELVERFEHWKVRYTLPDKPWERWRIINKEIKLGRYRKYSGSNRVAFKDLVEK